MSVTHQEIVDRLEALNREHSAAYQAELARVKKEQESLQEMCGGIGHVFGPNKDRYRSYPYGIRYCVFCDTPEK